MVQSDVKLKFLSAATRKITRKEERKWNFLSSMHFCYRQTQLIQASLPLFKKFIWQLVQEIVDELLINQFCEKSSEWEFSWWASEFRTLKMKNVGCLEVMAVSYSDYRCNRWHRQRVCLWTSKERLLHIAHLTHTVKAWWCQGWNWKRNFFWGNFNF